uniref:Uncharacterized protein n=1 Tax=Manihot esculenta TaxID=3983 RepID=A0A2C9UR86_MANES
MGLCTCQLLDGLLFAFRVVYVIASFVNLQISSFINLYSNDLDIMHNHGCCP